MQYWQLPYLGIRKVPQELSQFELQAFFMFTPHEQGVILGRRDRLHKLGLALHLGFLRMAGRSLAAFRIVPPALLSHLGTVLNLDTPDIASLRSLYRREKTLFEHQQLACEILGFARMSEHQRRALVRFLRQESEWEFDRDRLLNRTRQWLYENQLLIEHERSLRSLIDKAIEENETALAAVIQTSLPAPVLKRWAQTLEGRHEGPDHPVQTWLWNSPRRQSVGQLKLQFSKISLLTDLAVPKHPLDALTVQAMRYYAQRLIERPPSAGRRIKEPRRTIEVACFMQVALMNATDTLIAMIRQRIADIWNQAAKSVQSQQAERGQVLVWLAKTVRELAEDATLTESELRQKLLEAVDKASATRPLSKAAMTREKLLENSRSVRALLARLMELPFESASPHPVLQAMNALRHVYQSKVYRLPTGRQLELGRIWRDLLIGEDRNRALQAAELATLLGLRRALKNGSVFIAHSFSYRNRESMLIPRAEWDSKRSTYLSKLKLSNDPKEFIEPIVEAVQARVKTLAEAVEAGKVSVNDGEVHLTALAAEPETRETAEARRVLYRQIPEYQLPEVILEVDSHVRFSWNLLGREPRSFEELLLLYAGLLAQATAHSAADISRMMSGLSPVTIKQSMHWLQEEPRLKEANAAVFDFMHRHPIAEHWGRADLASADMMSLETSRLLWSARVDPRRRTKSMGMYSHVWHRWGILYNQPVILNDRQAGPAIEGVLRQDNVDIAQLAVDTHGYTDFAMLMAKMLRFDLCPRLRDLRSRKLFVTPEIIVPEILLPVTVRNVHLDGLEAMWSEFTRVIASVDIGQMSAVDAMLRFGAAARGDPLYDAGVQGGRLLRTLFLCDWMTIDRFRRELQNVLNRGESVHVLQRTVHTGKVPPHQAKRPEEFRGTSAALTLLCNVVMAWTTQRMQRALDNLDPISSQKVTAEALRHIAPVRLENINFRGEFRFPIERYAVRLLPSQGIHASTTRSAG